MPISPKMVFVVQPVYSIPVAVTSITVVFSNVASNFTAVQLVVPASVVQPGCSPGTP
jgi:hypothetical protein